MNKNEFVSKLSLETGFSKKVCDKFLKSEFEILKGELNIGNEIFFKNVGKIFVRVRGERILKVANKEFLIPQKNEAKIKLFKSFKNIVK